MTARLDGLVKLKKVCRKKYRNKHFSCTERKQPGWKHLFVSLPHQPESMQSFLQLSIYHLSTIAFKNIFKNTTNPTGWKFKPWFSSKATLTLPLINHQQILRALESIHTHRIRQIPFKSSQEMEEKDLENSKCPRASSLWRSLTLAIRAGLGSSPALQRIRFSLF